MLFSLTRNAAAVSGTSVRLGEDKCQDVVPVVSEMQLCGFVLEGREADHEYRISTGDVVADDYNDGDDTGEWRGLARGASAEWAERRCFESARGRVRCRLWSRSVDDAWRVRAAIDVDVVPSKLGEERYLAMAAQLRGLAAGLVLDLVSKSSAAAGYRLGRAGVSSRSAHIELRLLEATWGGIARALQSISASPWTTLRRQHVSVLVWGSEHIATRGLRQLTAQGADPRRGAVALPLRVASERLAETNDTPEHRTIVGVLDTLRERVRECIQSIRRHVMAIEVDRRWRDARIGPGPSLYERIDVPRIERLRVAEERGIGLLREIEAAKRLPFLVGLTTQHRRLTGPVFDHVGPYFRLRVEFLRYLETSFVVLDQFGDERIKATSRMFEQWVYLQLLAAFRSLGLVCGNLGSLVREHARHRFLLDLDRGTTVTFPLDEHRCLRVRYEPWIVPQRAALAEGESVYRGRAGDTAWCPDVLLELLTVPAHGQPATVLYAVVVDAKYTKTIREDHWRRTNRYLQIRSTSDNRQVVRQLWLAHPGERDGVTCRDEATLWTERGPDRPKDETIEGAISLSPPDVRVDDPDSEGATLDPTDTTVEFARGLLGYFATHFGHSV